MQTAGLKTDSPIEAAFLAAIKPLLRDGVEIETQETISTAKRNYRVDFLMTVAGRKMVVECDGKDFHEYQADLNRDCHLLNTGGIDGVLRFRGCDINFAMPEVLRCVAMLIGGSLDEDHPPLRAEHIPLVSPYFLNGDSRPILRINFPMDEIYPLLATVKSSVCSILGTTNEKQTVAMQLRSPFFDRKFRAPAVWKLGDHMRQRFNEVTKDWVEL